MRKGQFGQGNNPEIFIEICYGELLRSKIQVHNVVICIHSLIEANLLSIVLAETTSIVHLKSFGMSMETNKDI